MSRIIYIYNKHLLEFDSWAVLGFLLSLEHIQHLIHWVLGLKRPEHEVHRSSLPLPKLRIRKAVLHSAILLHDVRLSQRDCFSTLHGFYNGDLKNVV